MEPSIDGRIPVVILTGFLGAGKTTLLNHILTAQHGKKICVIENEFGEVGVDDALVKQRDFAEEDVFEMNNGCICCTVRGDLIKIITGIIAKKGKLDCIIIETTGLADPAPVAQTFFVDENVRSHCELDGIITVVDAKHILEHLDDEKAEGVENEASEQIAFADRILLNKIDLVDDKYLMEVEKRIRGINGQVQIIKTTQSRVDVNQVLGIRAFDLAKIMKMEPSFLDEDGQDHEHDKSVTSVGLKFQGDLLLFEIQQFIGGLLKIEGPNLFRYKGVLSIRGHPLKYVFQGVHMLFDGEFTVPWKKNEIRENRFVWIGRNLNRELLTSGIKSCVAPTTLRFGKKQKVMAHVASGWKQGTVLLEWDEGNPYRIRLEDGTDCWAPADNDEFVRKV